MSEKIGTEKIAREDGFLYYVGKDGAVWKAPMRHNKTGKKAKMSAETVKKEAGFMYFLGKDGYVHRAKLKNSA